MGEKMGTGETQDQGKCERLRPQMCSMTDGVLPFSLLINLMTRAEKFKSAANENDKLSCAFPLIFTPL